MPGHLVFCFICPWNPVLYSLGQLLYSWVLFDTFLYFLFLDILILFIHSSELSRIFYDVFNSLLGKLVMFILRVPVILLGTYSCLFSFNSLCSLCIRLNSYLSLSFFFLISFMLWDVYHSSMCNKIKFKTTIKVNVQNLKLAKNTWFCFWSGAMTNLRVMVISSDADNC